MNQETRKAGKPLQEASDLAIYPAASDTDALQFVEGVAEVIENVARQQGLLGLITVKNRDLGRAPA